MNKKTTHWLSLLVAVVLILALLAGCGTSGSSDPTDETVASTTTAATTDPPDNTTEQPTESSDQPDADGISVTDMAGRSIELAGPARRIVALTAADVEILYAIGAGDTLVGRGEYCNYPEDVLDVPSVQSGNETNIEQIIALKPDIIIMSTMAQTQEQVAALENAGIIVAVSDAQDIDGIYEAIIMIGQISGMEATAEDLVNQMQMDLSEIAAQAKAAATGDAKTVYFEVSPLEWGLWAAGSDTFMNEAAELIGLDNAFADVVQWGEVSQEQVLERNPDIIVTIAMYFGDGPLPVDEILSRDGWQNIRAVADKRVFNADTDELARPGPRLVDGIKSLYEFVYEN